MELHHPIMSKLWDLGGRTKRKEKTPLLEPLGKIFLYRLSNLSIILENYLLVWIKWLAWFNFPSSESILSIFFVSPLRPFFRLYPRCEIEQLWNVTHKESSLQHPCSLCYSLLVWVYYCEGVVYFQWFICLSCLEQVIYEHYSWMLCFLYPGFLVHWYCN